MLGSKTTLKIESSYCSTHHYGADCILCFKKLIPHLNQDKQKKIIEPQNPADIRQDLNDNEFNSSILAMKNQKGFSQIRKRKHHFSIIGCSVIIFFAFEILVIFPQMGGITGGQHTTRRTCSEKCKQHQSDGSFEDVSNSEGNEELLDFDDKSGCQPSLRKALECLRQTKPNLPDQLCYPQDAFQHFRQIHHRLQQWAQHTDHVPFRAARYGGPWIENYWITHFQQELESKNNYLPGVFGPYIPILIPWLDVWVTNGYTYPKGLASALKDVLREDVMYITVSQNDDGFVGCCTEFDDIQSKYQITILSAGGYGHVPIPLLKQPENFRQKNSMEERKHLISYVGSDKHAPDRMREKLIAQKNFFYYYSISDDWRDIMAESKFSLCPRGYGRTSYHVVETLQLGLIPIHVYLEGDRPWLPYGDLMKDISYTVSNENLPDLITELSNMPDSEIERMEEKIKEVRHSFTYEGVLEQISKFMLNPSSSELVCQALPSDSGTQTKNLLRVCE